MTENQKSVFREIRRRRGEGVVLIRSLFLILVMMTVVTLAMLSSEDRKVDDFNIFAIMGGVYLVLVVVIPIVRYVRDSRHIRTLRETDAARVLSEMEDGIYDRRLKTMTTNNYLVNIDVGMFVIPMEDVLLVHKNINSVDFIPANTELTVKTRSARDYLLAGCSFYSRKKKKLQDKLMLSLRESHPHIMLGYNDENLYAYQQEITYNKKQ